MQKFFFMSLAAFLAASQLHAKDVPSYPEPAKNVSQLNLLVDKALAAKDRGAMVKSIVELKALVPKSSPIFEVFAEFDGAKASDEQTRDLWERLQQVADMLAFVPLAEAELPQGFPTYTPVGMIEKKYYPKQRLAMAKDFMTLFRHISTNGITMTAPVQMEYNVSEYGNPEQESMAFFYASTDIGKSGERGSVNVIDREPLEVVALGVRGGVNREIIRDAKTRLEQWADAQKGYEADGPLRVMGYNSPMVRRKNQFHEIQLPLKKVEPASAQ